MLFYHADGSDEYAASDSGYDYAANVSAHCYGHYNCKGIFVFSSMLSDFSSGRYAGYARDTNNRVEIAFLEPVNHIAAQDTNCTGYGQSKNAQNDQRSNFGVQQGGSSYSSPPVVERHSAPSYQP